MQWIVDIMFIALYTEQNYLISMDTSYSLIFTPSKEEKSKNYNSEKERYLFHNKL